MKRLLLAVVVLTLAACRDWEGAYENAIDGGAVDAGPIDAGATDAGSTDAGSSDAGSSDAGSSDAGWCGGQWCLFSAGGSAQFASTEGVWASGPNDAWVTAYGSRLLHWDGVAWRTVPLTGYNIISSGVWGTSATSLFVTGDNGSYRGPPFDATHELTVPGAASLLAIHGLSDGGSVYATGTNWDIYRLDGSQFVALDAGAPPRSLARLRGLAVVAADDVWAAGTSGVVLHSTDGVTWNQVDAGVTANLRRVFANGPHDVWVVGESGLVLRWNGTGFVQGYCVSCGDLWGVWGRGSDDMWLLDSGGVLVHWDGQRYTPLAGVPPNADPSSGVGLWGFGDNDLFLSTQFADGGGGALHYRR